MSAGCIVDRPKLAYSFDLPVFVGSDDEPTRGAQFLFNAKPAARFAAQHLLPLPADAVVHRTGREYLVLSWRVERRVLRRGVAVSGFRIVQVAELVRLKPSPSSRITGWPIVD